MSCGSSGIMKNVKVELLKSDKVVSITPDTTFHASFPEVLNAFRLQIVNDTIIVIQESANSSNASHFKVYSLNTFSFLGAIVRNGRGPGEMLYPNMVNCSPESEYLNINHSPSGEAYSIDVSETLRTGKTDIAGKFTFPAGTIDWLPLPYSRHFILQSENGKLLLRHIGDNGGTINTFNYNECLDDESFITYLSCLFAGNGESGEVAELMMFFPIINIIDTEDGTLKSIAVDKSYREWESVTSGMIDKDTRQYYVNAASSRDYILAAYKNTTLEQLIIGGQGTSIHVFDWEGDFLYDIKVNEDIESMTFDDRTKYLYCIEKSERRILRYDLSEVL